MNFRPQPIVSVLILSLGIFASPASADSSSRRTKLDRALADVVASGSSTAQQAVIIRTQPGQLAAVESRITTAAHGGTIDSRHTAISAVSAHVAVADLDALVADPAVLSVSTNARVKGFANPN